MKPLLSLSNTLSTRNSYVIFSWNYFKTFSLTTYRNAATKSCVISSSGCCDVLELLELDSSLSACILATHCKNSVSSIKPVPVNGKRFHVNLNLIYLFNRSHLSHKTKIYHRMHEKFKLNLDYDQQIFIKSIKTWIATIVEWALKLNSNVVFGKIKYSGDKCAHQSKSLLLQFVLWLMFSSLLRFFAVCLLKDCSFFLSSIETSDGCLERKCNIRAIRDKSTYSKQHLALFDI